MKLVHGNKFKKSSLKKRKRRRKMNEILFVTYGGDSCFFEEIHRQQEHVSRIVKWLNSCDELSVLAFCLDNEPGTDMLVAVGACCHQDLFDSLRDRDMFFDFEGKKYSVGGDIGGFCAKKKGIDVVYTRDSREFGPIRSMIGNIHRQMILLRMNQMLKTANLSKNQKTRKDKSPRCKKPILSFENQIKKLTIWKDVYEKWDYKGEKGGFPEIPSNIVELAKAVPVLDGFRPAIEINFYLSTLEEHIDFIFQKLWHLELSEGKDFYWYGNKEFGPYLKSKNLWPGKSIHVVGIDVEAYALEEMVSAWKVWQMSDNPVHIELFTHLLMHGKEYQCYIDIPGLRLEEGRYNRLCYRIIPPKYGIAIDSSEECLSSGFIPSRIF